MDYHRTAIALHGRTQPASRGEYSTRNDGAVRQRGDQAKLNVSRGPEALAAGLMPLTGFIVAAALATPLWAAAAIFLVR